MWLGDSSVLYINSTNAAIPGGAELWVSDINNFKNGQVPIYCNLLLSLTNCNCRYKAASLPASFSGLKAVATESGDVRFVVYGQSHGNGTAYNEKLATAPQSSARIYDSIYVRHWNTWLTTTFNAVFSGTLKANSTRNATGKPRYTAAGRLHNLVSGIKNAESPYPPFGDKSDYDLSLDGKWVAFKSKAPELPKANITTSYIYLVPHDGSRKPYTINGLKSSIKPNGVEGDSSSPVFSPNSDKLAYFQMKSNENESDRNVLYVYSIGSNATISSVAKNWDRSPDTVKWAPNGEYLVVTSDDRGRSRLFSIPADAGKDFKPRNFTNGGSPSAYYQLPDSTWLVTGSTFLTSWDVYTASPEKGVIETLASANEIDPELKGIRGAAIDEFYYKGNWTDVKVHLFFLYFLILTYTDPFMAHIPTKI